MSFGYKYVRTALMGARGVGEVVLCGEGVPGIVVSWCCGIVGATDVCDATQSRDSVT